MYDYAQLADLRKGENREPLPEGVPSNGLVASLVAKSGPALCFGLTGFNNSASAQFIQVFDLSQLPADGAAPVTVFKAAAGDNFGLDYGTYGRAFLRGVVVCNSSTLATKTIGSADCWFDIVVV